MDVADDIRIVVGYLIENLVVDFRGKRDEPFAGSIVAVILFLVNTEASTDIDDTLRGKYPTHLVLEENIPGALHPVRSHIAKKNFKRFFKYLRPCPDFRYFSRTLASSRFSPISQ